MSFRKTRNKSNCNIIRRGKVLTIRNLTKEQEQQLERSVELYRFTYNWALSTMEEYYQAHKHEEKKYLTDKELQRLLSDMRNSEEYKWLKDVPLSTLRNAMFDAINSRNKWLSMSYKNRQPKYKTKKNSKKSFSPRSERSYLDDNKFKISGFKEKFNIGWHSGWSKSDGSVLRYSNIRVFKDTDGKWKISFTYLRPKIESKYFDPYNLVYIPKYPRAIGIDLNKYNLIVTSYMNGEIFRLPNEIEKYWKKYLKLESQVVKDNKLTRRYHPEITNWDEIEDFSEYKSNNAKKRQIKCNKARRKVHNYMITYIRDIAKKIITRYPKAIVMENINVVKMYSRNIQAKSIAYIPFYTIRVIFQEKCEEYGIPFILASKDYPSTQRCSCCGYIQKMGSKHTYRCHVCGMIKDRDINAAFNLEQLAYKDCIDALEWIA